MGGRLGALRAIFGAGRRQTCWKAEVAGTRRRSSAHGEAATVDEIGQATDKVEVDRLLELITEKAAQVMEAQACSLLVRAETWMP